MKTGKRFRPFLESMSYSHCTQHEGKFVISETLGIAMLGVLTCPSPLDLIIFSC